MTTEVITHKDRLKRFLYNSVAAPKYLTGDAEARKCYEPDNLDVLKEILVSGYPDLLLGVIEMVNSENLLPRRETIFVALAFAATTTYQVTDVFRHKVYTTLLNVCRDDKDFFTFVKFYKTARKNFSSALNKAAFAYYTRKDPMVLARDVARQKRYHGWTHKDVIKLAHGKTEKPLTNVVIRYILYGLNKAKEYGENIVDSEGILKFLTNAQTLRRCEKPEDFPQLIAEVEASLIHVPSYFHKTLTVWESILPFLELNFVIQKLPLLFKYGFLRANSPFQNKIIEMLNDQELIRSSQISPIEVFIGLRNFEKGGKPMDPRLIKHLKNKEATLGVKSGLGEGSSEEKKKETPKSPAIISALNKTLQLSYENFKPTGKRYLITIEISEKMKKPCLKTKNLSCLEAALSMTLLFLKTERDVTIAVFNNHQINVVHLDKNGTLSQALTKVQQANHGYVHLAAALDWATRKKRNVDIFLNFVYNNRSLESAPKEIRDRARPMAAFEKYKRNKNQQPARMITFSLASPNLNLADGTPNALDVCGFDKNVPKVVEAFCRGYFI